MRVRLRTYRIITEICLWAGIFSACLFDKVPPRFHIMVGTIAILAALVSITTYFYNLGLFERFENIACGQKEV